MLHLKTFKKQFMNRFDFESYRSLGKSKRMLIRFIIYGLVILFLVYLIQQKYNQTAKNKEIDSIDRFEVEVENG